MMSLNVSVSPLFVAVGYIAGAFTPAVLRKVKALFVKEGNAAKAAVSGEVKKVL